MAAVCWVITVRAKTVVKSLEEAKIWNDCADALYFRKVPGRETRDAIRKAVL